MKQWSAKTWKHLLIANCAVLGCTLFVFPLFILLPIYSLAGTTMNSRSSVAHTESKLQHFALLAHLNMIAAIILACLLAVTLTGYIRASKKKS